MRGVEQEKVLRDGGGASLTFFERTFGLFVTSLFVMAGVGLLAVSARGESLLAGLGGVVLLATMALAIYGGYKDGN